jgi:hypothetical protein
MTMLDGSVTVVQSNALTGSLLSVHPSDRWGPVLRDAADWGVGSDPSLLVFPQSWPRFFSNSLVCFVDRCA